MLIFPISSATGSQRPVLHQLVKQFKQHKCERWYNLQINSNPMNHGNWSLYLPFFCLCHLSFLKLWSLRPFGPLNASPEYALGQKKGRGPSPLKQKVSLTYGHVSWNLAFGVLNLFALQLAIFVLLTHMLTSGGGCQSCLALLIH